MAKRIGRKGSKCSSAIATIAFFIAVIAVVIGRFNSSFETNPQVTTSSVSPASAEACSVHFIDVGQGSSVLIQSGDKGILIDAGEKEYGDDVVNYINSHGVTELDYVIATHPHTDHIGGLLTVLKSVKVKNIIMPKLTADNTPTTKTYENFLQIIYDKKIKAIAASYGKKYEVDKIKLTILGPTEQNKDINNMSVICKADVNSTVFLFSGDAEEPEMKSVLKKSPDLSCDVMLMGHHGSRTSLEENYLSNADPSVAVIQCGLNNSYKHPHEETIDYLESNSIKYYRTDLSGSVVFSCSERGYSISTSK